MSEYITNPDTGRPCRVGGMVYKKLMKRVEMQNKLGKIPKKPKLKAPQIVMKKDLNVSESSSDLSSDSDEEITVKQKYKKLPKAKPKEEPKIKSKSKKLYNSPEDSTESSESSESSDDSSL